MSMSISNLGPGDEKDRHGNYVHPTAAEELYPGEAVTLDSNGQATRTAANGTDKVVGVVTKHAASGDDVTVKTNGTVVAAVEADAAAGSTVGTHNGNAENVDAGEMSVNGSEYSVVEVASQEDPRDGSSQEYGLLVLNP